MSLCMRFRKFLNLENFKISYLKDLSPYFNETFSDTILSINSHNTEKSHVLTVDFILNEKSANVLKIVHGGAMISLIENFSDVALKYFNKINSRTTDININFLKQTELNKNMKLKIIIEKMGNATFFIDAQITNEKEDLCCNANLIKSKANPKF